MATSGTFTTALGTGLYLTMNWSTVSQDVARNISTVKVDLVLAGDRGISAPSTRAGQITINGNHHAISFFIGTTGSAWSKIIGSYTAEIAHNADGTKTAAISAWADINVTWAGTYVGRGSISGAVTPNVIPRASSLSGYPTSIDGGATFSATINRASSSFTHDVKFSFWSAQRIVTGQTTAVSYTIPTSWLGTIPNHSSGTMTVTITTKNGSTVVGSKTYSVTLKVPASATPSFGSLTTARVDGPVPAAWDIYVQNKSKVTVSINAPEGIYGSSIQTYKIVGAGHTKMNASATFDLPTSGTITFTGTVIDTRGRSFSRTASITVTPYAPPKLTKFEADRSTSGGVVDSEGTYIRALIDDVVDSVSGKNSTITRLVEYKISTGSTWTNAGSYTDNVAKIFGSGGISTNNVYDIRVSVTDAFTTITASNQVSTAFVTMDFYRDGTGIAFGKVSSLPGIFESALPIRATGGYDTPYLATGEDLNAYNFPCDRAIPSNAVASSLINSPSAAAGALQVLRTVPGGTIQYYHEYWAEGGKTWRRRYYGAWSPWRLNSIEGEYTYGSSSAGRWRRNEVTGLQECWINTSVSAAINSAYGSLFQGTWRWTYPRAFNNAGSVHPKPTVTVGRFQHGTGASWGAISDIADTYADLRGIDAFSRTAGTTHIAAYAIGYTTS